MNSAIPYLCRCCGGPILGSGQFFGGLYYHHECAKPPAQYYQSLPLSVEDIRRIVREEIAKSQEPQWKSA